MRALLLGLVCCGAFCASLAQAPPAAVGSEALSATLGFTETYDSSAGPSSELDADLGYAFWRRFSLHAGAPFVLAQNLTAASPKPAASAAPKSGSMSAAGDAYLNLAYDAPNPRLHLTSTLTATAPTGDSSSGLSSGRPTFAWTNNFSHDFDLLAPFFEVSAGDGSEAMNAALRARRIRTRNRSFTALGTQVDLRAGSGISLGNKLSLQASAYGVLPVGNQKIYSRLIKAQSGAASGSSGSASAGALRQAQRVHVIVGPSSLAADHGLTADLDFNALSCLEFDTEIGRSLHLDTTTLSFTMSWHFGGSGPIR